jgi:phage gp45-like
VGQLYNGQDKPKHDDELVDAGSGQVAKRVLASRKGHELLFDEEKGVRLSTSDGAYRLELDSAGTAVTIDSGGTITVHGTGAIEIKGDADVTVSAATKLTLSGGSAVEISAPTVKVAGSGTLDLEGGGSATLSAGIVRIN